MLPSRAITLQQSILNCVAGIKKVTLQLYYYLKSSSSPCAFPLKELKIGPYEMLDVRGACVCILPGLSLSGFLAYLTCLYPRITFWNWPPSVKT